jgi:hypothetical protein
MRARDVLAVVLVAILGLAVPLGSGCVHVQPVPTPSSDATCQGVCSHADKLGCSYAHPPTATCEEVCENATASGIPWQLSCLATVTNCEPLACP